MAVTHFHPYFFGQKSRVRTNHVSLLWLYKRTGPSHQVARWLESLAEFNFLLKHSLDQAWKYRWSQPLPRLPQCARFESRDGDLIWAKLASSPPQMTTISLAPTFSTAEWKQLQQTSGSPVALAKNNLLTGFKCALHWWKPADWSLNDSSTCSLVWRSEVGCWKIFCYLEVPKWIYTEQGGAIWVEVYGWTVCSWELRKSHTTPYHPQANGVV